MPSYTVETHLRIYDDSDGSFLSISPDADALGLIEIRSCLKSGEIEAKGNARVVMNLEQAILFHKSLGVYIEAMKGK